MTARWSIGLLSGPAPDRLAPMFRHPVVTPDMVTDVLAQLVADPFILRHRGQWCMFFEILPKGGKRGVIGLSTSLDLAHWRYEQVVLSADIHLSYPHLLRSGDDVFMVVETLGRGCVSLYRATAFPHEWRFEAPPLDGQHADPTVFRYDGTWWMFTCPCPYEHDRLNLFHADTLTGPRQVHAANPLVVDDPARARPAGQVVSHGGRLLRFAQNCVPVHPVIRNPRANGAVLQGSGNHPAAGLPPGRSWLECPGDAPHRYARAAARRVSGLR
jgi:hypothetical protein